MNCYILSRVSSVDQQDGFSPEAQVQNCEEYAKSKGYNIVEIVNFQESATYKKIGKKDQESDRKEFKRVLRRLEDEKKSKCFIGRYL